MKRFALTAMALAIGLAVTANTATAADKVTTSNERVYKMDAAHMDSKHLVGMKVETPDGKRAGEIDHMIVNTKDGKVSHVIVGVGGLAGVGERHVVVPWSQVKIRQDGKDPKDHMAVIDRATLDQAPRYTRASDRAPAASPAMAPSADKDRDGVRNKDDRAPKNPTKQ
jgi:sporulation protein YlmC with PRC-barrel domain